jgi:hypothetical protein
MNSKMMQYCTRHAHGNVSVFAVEYVEIIAGR